VTTPAQRSALSALDAARPTIARLESDQNSEDRAADLIESWSAVETALRSLVGGSTLTGRALIHELRSRHVITLAQANALAEFEAARSRAQRPGYEPTQGDVNAGLDAFVKLEAGVRAGSAGQADTGPPARTPPPAPASVPGGAPLASSDGVSPATTGAARPEWLRWVLIGVAVVAVVGLGTWAYMSSRESTLEQAVAHYAAGRREQAQAAFERAAREDPRSALPHVYLSRMARDVGNLTLARDEANKAIQAEPGNSLALREMGAYLLTSGNYELARRFYTRAVGANPTDSTAMGYLGCASIRVGRVDEGQRWLARAGPGNWSSCASMTPGAPGAVGMPGGVVPPGQQLPPQAPPRVP
jgi:predicted ribosomally synthesized peptide with SipW-like signal peptide